MVLEVWIQVSAVPTRHCGSRVPWELGGGQEEGLGRGGDGWRGGRPGAPMWAAAAAPALTAGQGPLPELMAPGFDPGQGGDGTGGGPSRGQALHKLCHILPSLGPPPVPTELKGAASAEPTWGSPSLTERRLQTQPGREALSGPAKGRGSLDPPLPPIPHCQSHVNQTLRHPSSSPEVQCLVTD